MEQPNMASHVVLVVDDEPAIRLLVATVLREEGYQVHEASNGQEALTLLSTVHPSVILLDMNMPVMNGWQFAEAVRQGGLPTKIVVMAAGQNVPRWAAEIAADGVLVKPFDLDALVRIVAEHCAPAPSS